MVDGKGRQRGGARRNANCIHHVMHFRLPRGGAQTVATLPMRASGPWIVQDPWHAGGVVRRMAQRWAQGVDVHRPARFPRAARAYTPRTADPVRANPPRVPLASAYARDMERSTETRTAESSRGLWSSTLTEKERGQFVHAAAAELAAERALPAAVARAAPASARLAEQGGDVRKEELQCVLLMYLVAQRRLPLARISAAYYPNAAFDDTLHMVPTDAAAELRRLQRAALYRLFHAELEASRLHGAACILHDARLRPAQPKHMLGMLLRRTARVRRAPPLGVDPQQSVRAALQEACDAICRRPPPDMRAHTFAAMLTQLAGLRMHATLLQWAALVAHTAVPDMDVRLLADVARRLCRNGALDEAFAYVQTLPLAWRTRGMYAPLLAHFGDAWLDATGALVQKEATPSAVLWHDLCTVPHLMPPGPAAYVARLVSHANHGRGAHALQDLRALRRAPVDEASLADAGLCAMRALLRQGRWSLAVRHARRHRRRHGTPPNATAWLNALVATLVEARVPQNECAQILSLLYTGLLRTPCGEAQRLPSTGPESASLLLFANAIVQYAGACAAHPDRTTLLLLVRAAAQWDESLDSRQLWHIAQLVLPEGRRHTRTDTGPVHSSNSALLVELAAAFARRLDHRSARSAQFLARQGRRRVQRPARAPRALPPHRP